MADTLGSTSGSFIAREGILVDSVWLSAPGLAIKLWRDAGGLQWLANPALTDWQAGLSSPDDWPLLAAALWPLCTATQPASATGLAFRTQPVRAVCVPLFDGWLVWLTPSGAEPAALPLPHLAQALALASMSVSVWRVDRATQRIEFNEIGNLWSGFAVRAGGVPLAEVRATIHPQDRRTVMLAAEAAMAGNGVVDVEARYLNADGSYRHLLTRRVAERDAQGNVVALVGISIDQTDRQLGEQALLDKAAAEQASRAKSDFLARLSHELRTPLNAVLGFSELMQSDSSQPLSPLQTVRAEHIRRAGRHLLALIDDVLDLTSVETGPPVSDELPVALDEIVADAVQWMQPQAAQARVQLHQRVTPAWVSGNARRLRQIAVNLLSNAVKYNRPGGEVWVDLQASARDGLPGWQLGVRDNGRGLCEAQMALLFEPFNRLGMEHEGISGSGIGLTIVRDLLQRMRGRIEVSSQPGQGSEFRAWWPAVEPPVTAPAALKTVLTSRSATDAATSEPKPLSVLYIEDNPVNVLLVEAMLGQRANMHLSCATDGASGVRAARALLPDVVLVDMQLPDFDGIEVLRQLNATPALAGATLIALSANAMPEDVARAMAAGFSDYWTKPIDVKQTLARLDALAAR